jgi:hypothetical protein
MRELLGWSVGPGNVFDVFCATHNKLEIRIISVYTLNRPKTQSSSEDGLNKARRAINETHFRQPSVHSFTIAEFILMSQ